MIVSRLIAALAYAGAAFLFGMALGERGELGVVQYVFAAVIPLATLVLTSVSREGRAYVLATGLVMFAGLAIGQQQFRNAWSDCLSGADGVRTALLARRPDYPARLEDLGMKLPCRCGFRATILHYMGNERGFRLWFTNDRERHVATDRLPFSSSGRSSGRSRT